MASCREEGIFADTRNRFSLRTSLQLPTPSPHFPLHISPLTMPVEHIKAPTPSTFSSALASATSVAASLSAPLFIHVRADWCSDCTRTDNTVSSAFSALETRTVLLTALVDDRKAYRSPDYAYRTDATLKITAIPTLIKMDGGRLVEGECGDAEKVARLVGVDESVVKQKRGCTIA